MSHRRFVAVGLVVMLVCAMVARSTTVSAYSADNLASGKTAPLELSVPTFDELALLPSGASGVAAEINGHSLMWNKVGGKAILSFGGLVQTSNAVGPTSGKLFGFCTYAVTSALFAIGAAGLAAASLAGGLVVAGIFLTPQFLAAAAIAATSFSALYSLVGAFVC